MVTNALLAAGVGWKLGMPVAEIAAGLSSAALTGGRLAPLSTGTGVTIIDDTYNANPESMAAAIETLADMPVRNGARRIIVLGRMGELGAHAPGGPPEDRRARRAARPHGGRRGRRCAKASPTAPEDAPYFPDLEEAAEWLSREVKPGDVVLFKGSRTATVENVMNAAFPQN